MKDLSQSVMERIESNEQFNIFFKNILNYSDIYLFGGAVRNYLDDEFENIRDFDFVIEFKNDKDSIAKFISNDLKYKRNRFNGYKIYLNDISIDMWEMKDTWAFSKSKLKPSPENLLKSVFLNLDSVLYSMNECTYINECNQQYLSNKRNKILDIILEDNPCIDLNLLRAIIMQEKYELSFSNSLKKMFLDRYNDVNFINSLMHIQYAHYNKEVFKKSYIEKVVECIINDM